MTRSPAMRRMRARKSIHWTFVASFLVATLTGGTSCAGSASTEPLILLFTSETTFWRQLDIAERIAQVATIREISALEPWLAHSDRRSRGNAAYIFARVGDRRGIAVLGEIRNDYSAERTIHADEMTLNWITTGDPKEDKERWEEYVRSPGVLREQIRMDRYHAVHLLGKLRDRSAVEILIPLLDHDEVGYNAAWALGEIGDVRAIPPLIAALASKDAILRVSAIGALEELQAAEAIPRLEALFDDREIPRAGEQKSVGTTARRAAASIRYSLDARN